MIVKITQAHYEHWDSERQKLLDEALERVWGRTGLIPASWKRDSKIAMDDLPRVLRSAMLSERVPSDTRILWEELLDRLQLSS